MRIPLATLGFFALLVACGADAPPHGEGGAPDVSSGVKHYEGTGTIAAVEGNHVRIEHDAIEGFMDPMTMSFELKEPSLMDGLEPGMDVRFRLEVSGRSVSIDRIEPGERPER